MRKKIIYLLSLLMALSLVFASCKKNGAGDISGPGPSDNGTDNSPTTDDGLAPDGSWLDSNSEAPIKNDKIDGLQSVGGQAYYRNPVIVVLGTKGNHVAVFTEKRYKSLGADNDIALDGSTAADIVSAISVDSGKSWNGVSLVGRTTAVTDPKDAVAAPVVFRVDNKTVVVVASAGVGLSRIGKVYTERGNDQVSKLMYTVGTYDENAGTFSWSTWADMTSTVKTAIDNASTTFNTKDGKQFAVHSGKGIVDDSGNMYFAVTVSDQGNGGTPKELMGNIMVKGTKPTGNSVTWTVIGNSQVKFNNITGGNFSTHKESRVIGVKKDNATTASDIEYIAVGNPWSNPANNKIGYNVAGQQPQDNGIPGSEGSPAYLNVLNWQGATSYDPSTYKYNEKGTRQQKLFAHVKTRNDTITMYALNDGFTSTGKAYTVIGYPQDTTALAKSSSMDVLGDGTIIMATEQGGSERVYNVVFKRFTQKFLATKLGIN